MKKPEEVPARGFRSAIRVLMISVLAIFTFEVAIMLLLHLLPPVSALLHGVLDGLVLSALVLPTLYLFWFRPLVRSMAEREQTHDELRRQREALYQSEKLAAMGRLLAGVAHELNNPVTSILMNANLMIEEVGAGSPLYKDLKKIDTDAGRCKRIIDDLRVFSRRREFHKSRCHVAAVVEQALGMVEHELDLRRIQVQREGGDRPVSEQPRAEARGPTLTSGCISLGFRCPTRLRSVTRSSSGRSPTH